MFRVVVGDLAHVVVLDGQDDVEHEPEARLVRHRPHRLCAGLGLDLDYQLL